VSSGHTLRDRVEFALFRAFAGLLVALPERWALATGRGLGWLAGSVLRVRRSVVDANIARAFPDQDAGWRSRTARASYRHLGAQAASTLRAIRSGVGSVRERTELAGGEALAEALREGGVILVSGHIGNWELLASGLAAHGFPIEAVAARQRNVLFDAELGRMRERLGIALLERSGARGEVLRKLDERRLVLLAADQDAGAGGVFVDFLGTAASTARGPAVLTLRSGARLFAAFCLANGDSGRYRIHLEEIPVSRGSDLRAEVLRITREHTQRLARFVRQVPEQYFWQHKRWKTRPEPTSGPPV
jgi:KDO2-lipid IV(A) lauroyltransferase